MQGGGHVDPLGYFRCLTIPPRRNGFGKIATTEGLSRELQGGTHARKELIIYVGELLRLRYRQRFLARRKSGKEGSCGLLISFSPQVVFV